MITMEELQRRMLERNPEFEAWAHNIPQTHWAKRDISAARMGWEAARAADSAPVAPLCMFCGAEHFYRCDKMPEYAPESVPMGTRSTVKPDSADVVRLVADILDWDKKVRLLPPDLAKQVREFHEAQT